MKRFITFFNLWGLLAVLIGWNPTIKLPFDQFIHQNTLADTQYIEYTPHASSNEASYARNLDALAIALHPGSDFTQENQPTPGSLNHCKSLVYRTLASLPPEDTAQLKDLTLYFADEGRRGLGGGSTIILRCQNVTDNELVGVLVHEMGHIVDTGLLQGNASAGESEFMDGTQPVYQDDPSLLFYRLDFTDSKTLRSSASPLDFVSGYAQSDPFEDFAETYNYYILHGDEFRTLIETNVVLLQKYNFLKTRVFNGKEFFNGDDARKTDLLQRDYDTTVLNYDLNKFFVT